MKTTKNAARKVSGKTVGKPTGKAKPAKKVLTAKPVKTVTHRASKPKVTHFKAKDANVQQVSKIEASFAPEETPRSYPVLMMKQTQSPDGHTGNFCQILLPGRKIKVVATGTTEVVTSTDESGTEKKRVVKGMRNVDVPALVPVWCRVIEGDERNGRAIVHLERPDADFNKGFKIRHAGGTALTPAKAVEFLTAAVRQ